MAGCQSMPSFQQQQRRDVPPAVRNLAASAGHGVLAVVLSLVLLVATGMVGASIFSSMVHHRVSKQVQIQREAVHLYSTTDSGTSAGSNIYFMGASKPREKARADRDMQSVRSAPSTTMSKD